MAWISALGAIVLIVSLEYQQPYFLLSACIAKLIFAIICLILVRPAIDLSAFKVADTTLLKKE